MKDWNVSTKLELLSKSAKAACQATNWSLFCKIVIC